MKFLVLLLVLAVAVGWVMLRTRRNQAPPIQPPPKPKAVAEMLACAHCGVHLPRAEAAFDAAGHAYCGPEHRVAGPP
jgi:uncharacterized protein